MAEALLALIPAPALIGFALLLGWPAPLSARMEGRLGAAAAGGSAALALGLAAWLFATGSGAIRVEVAPFVVTGGLEAMLALRFDALSAVASGTVGVVGVLVVLYTAEFMPREGETRLRRLFALLSLFLAGMFAVVLADDLVALFLGWEIVGLCSYFLIGWRSREAAAADAARQAFVVTRIGDALLLAGIAALFARFGTTSLPELFGAVEGAWRGGATLAAGAIGALVLAGALAKSAQVPFHVWLPDAMAGPTPVSALLHAATMVAAGAFLLARLAPLTEAAPGIGAATAWLGLAGALGAGLAALAQRDVKRLLAWSTVSQIGFMFLALGAGAPGAAMAHFVTHAAFKAALFLAAGLVSREAGHERRLDRLGGARRRGPLGFWVFAAAALALGGAPWVTAGFWSKELVLAGALGAGPLGPALWAGAVAASAVTAAYAGRAALALARGGAPREGATDGPGAAEAAAVLVLAALALGLGPAAGPVAEAVGGAATPHLGAAAAGIGVAAPLAGFSAALLAEAGWAPRAPRLAAAARGGFGVDAIRGAVAGGFGRMVHAVSGDPLARGMHALAGGVPRLAATFASGAADRAGPRAPGGPEAWRRRGAERLARFARAPGDDLLDRLWRGVAAGAAGMGRMAGRAQGGRLRGYLAGSAIGAALLLLLGWAAA